MRHPKGLIRQPTKEDTTRTNETSLRTIEVNSKDITYNIILENGKE